MLEPVQQELLAALVRAARGRSPSERSSFFVTSQLGKGTLDISHPGLGADVRDAHRTDLRVLEDEGYIVVHDQAAYGPAEFDITPRGYQCIEDPAAAAAARPQRRRWGRWVAVDDKAYKVSAMGAIWRVRDEQDADAPWRALKEMRYPKGRGAAPYQRFVREIRTLAENLKERHPNIIEVIDFAIPAPGDTRKPYFVMPLAKASLHDVSTMLVGELAPVLRMLIPVADALHAAHEAGVIHRDVKPGNVLLFGDDRTPVVCDFGIAYLEEEERLTRVDGSTVGTDAFVAPELLGGGRSGAVTRAADVYSFAKTLFAAVSGGDVFPRERWDDERFDLARRFGDARLAHVRGLMQAMVVEDPAARPQTMAGVRVLVERALANVRDGEPFRDGMYGGGHSATERLGGVRRALGQPAGVAKRDAVLRAVADSVAAAEAEALEYGARPSKPPFQQQIHETAGVAAAAAEHLMSTGLAIVETDDREPFEEWLGEATEAASNRDGYQYAHDRMIMSLGGVLAAHGAAALAWHRRRLGLLGLVVDRYVASGSAWIYHTALMTKAAVLLPWMTEALMRSAVLERADPDLAGAPREALALVSGFAAIKFVAAADPDRMRRFLAAPAGLDFPTEFAPGLFDTSWAPALLDIGSKRGPLEREIARDVFGMKAEEFRALVGRLSPALAATSAQVNLRHDRMPEYRLGVDAQRWKAWCGGDL